MKTSKNFNYELEKNLLSQIIYDMKIIDVVSSEINANDFHSTTNKTVYKALKTMHDAFNEDFDYDLFKEYLSKSDKIKVQDEYINELIENAITASTYASVTQRIKELSLLRSISEAAQTALINSSQGDQKPNDIIDKLEHDINMLNTRNGLNNVIPISNLTSSYFENMSDVKLESIKTGYEQLDNVLQGGIKRSDLIIIAARPGMGKTSFALNLGMNMAKEKKHVLLFTLEMANDQLLDRLLAAKSKVPLNNIIQKNYVTQPKETEKITAALDELTKYTLYIADTANVTINDIKQMARKKHAENELDVIIIDYLQLITTSSKTVREQEVAEVSRTLKILSKELQVPIIALAQLSRNVEHRTDPRPTLSDIRESGSIEQDADVVMFLYRTQYYKNVSANDSSHSNQIMELLIKKHRHGQQGVVLLNYDLKIQKFSNTTIEQENSYKAAQQLEKTNNR